MQQRDGLLTLLLAGILQLLSGLDAFVYHAKGGNMLSVKIDEVSGIAILEPSGPLSKSDFKLAAKTIDPYIEKHGALKGLVIHVESFPGWDSFAALSYHLEFIKGHHKHISRLAVSTDSAIGKYAKTIASHFVNAEIKVFPFKELDQAKKWILGDV